MPRVVSKKARPCLYRLRSGSPSRLKRLISWLSRKIRIWYGSAYKKSCAISSKILFRLPLSFLLSKPSWHKNVSGKSIAVLRWEFLPSSFELVCHHAEEPVLLYQVSPTILKLGYSSFTSLHQRERKSKSI